MRTGGYYRPPHSEAEKEKILEEYDALKEQNPWESNQKIARKCGIDRKTVYNWKLKKMKVPMKGQEKSNLKKKYS